MRTLLRVGACPFVRRQLPVSPFLCSTATCRRGGGAAAATVSHVRFNSLEAGTARPSRSQFLQKRHDAPAGPVGATTEGGEPVRYGPLDVDLKPRDQLRPLLPTWNPPPTRAPLPEELELSTRLRMKFEDRWWAATVREIGEPGAAVKVGYDGWPGRHDEWLERNSDRLFLHESFHEDYVAPPLPQRFQRPVPLDDDGNPLPVTPRRPRPKVFDPEKERMKRALRPPLPYNPEKERLKRQLRGQYPLPLEDNGSSWMEQQQVDQPEQQVPPQQEVPQQHAPQQQQQQQQVPQQQQHVPQQHHHHQQAQPAQQVHAQVQPQAQAHSGDRHFGLGAVQGGAAAAAQAVPAAAAPPPGPPPPQLIVEWVEVPPASAGAPRTFRHAGSGEIRHGAPPSGWAEILAEGGARYYWHVGRNITQWDRPMS